MTPGTYRYWLRLSLAPLCLCLVVVLHGARVYLVDQTPWKGGGFGMFSTVNTRGSRFLRVYLAKGDQRYPIALPRPLQKYGHEFRAAPTAERCEQLAKRLASFRWLDDRWRQHRLASSAVVDGGQSPRLMDRFPHSEDLLAIAGHEEAPSGELHVADCDSVWIELWHYSFDKANCRLIASKKHSTSAKLENQFP